MYTPEQYVSSAHSNPHWTTGIIFVYYFFLGCFGGEAFYLNKFSYFFHTGPLGSFLFIIFWGTLVGKHSI